MTELSVLLSTCYLEKKKSYDRSYVSQGVLHTRIVSKVKQGFFDQEDG